MRGVFYHKGFPATDYDPAIGPGYFFENRDNGYWIGPFADKGKAELAEYHHYAIPEPMPMWATWADWND